MGYKQGSKDYGGKREEHIKDFKEQGERCAICRIPLYFNGNTKRDVAKLDHCHTSGEFRGFLCGNCNLGLGLFKDNIEILYQAIEYITEHRDKSKFWKYLKENKIE